RRGRFRDYLRTALMHLVSDYRRQRQQAPRPLGHDPPEVMAPADGDEVDFVATWRQELLEQAWQVLAADHPAYHAVLRLRTVEPELSSAAMAARLTVAPGKPVTAAWVRKTQQRAQQKFADLLLDEVAQSLAAPTPEALRA